MNQAYTTDVEATLHNEEDDTQAVRVPVWIDQLTQDMRYGLRQLRRAPGFSAVVILTLALGIGVNTAIFSVVNALLLKPLAYKDSDRIVRLVMNAPASESPTGRPLRASLGLSAAEIREVRSRVRTLSDVGSTGIVLRGLTGKEDGARLRGARVSSTVLHMLDARPIRGRAFRADDEAAGAEPVILLSHGAWQQFFASGADVVGRTLTMDSVLGPRTQTRYTVVGVMPPSFSYPDSQTHFWIAFQPTSTGAPLRDPLVARLSPGVSIPEAVAEIGSILRDVRPQAPLTRYELVREQDELVAPVKRAVLVVAAAVGFVLLIACVNVANLLLARTAARQREVAIRVAIGASRGRLVRQMLTESLVLALVGGAVGITLAHWGVRLFQWLAATHARIDLAPGIAFPRIDEIAIDLTVLAFTIATCLLTGTIFGLAPALVHSRTDPVAALKESREAVGVTFIARVRMRGGLVVAEVALVMVLLVGSGLLVGSLVKLSTVDPGYRARDVLTFQVSLPLGRFPDERLGVFAEDLVNRLRAVPGVVRAAYANQLPMVNLRDTAGGLWSTPDPARRPTPNGPDARVVSRDYFNVFGIRVLTGRGFTENDRLGQPRVLVVNQALASRQFGGEDAVGRLVFVGRDVTPWQIVGVVDNVRQFGLDRQPEPQFFVDMRQWSGTGPRFPVGAYYAVRTHANPLRIVSDVRRQVRALDEEAALFNVETMEALVANTITQPRLYAVLLTTFAAVGLVLALTGIYGLLAYSVTQRTHEIGVRMSLGARRADVLRLVLRESLTRTAIGIVFGLVGAAAVSRYLEGMLFGLTPLDPRTFAAMPLLFFGIATLASYLPARRAANVDPLIALRYE